MASVAIDFGTLRTRLAVYDRRQRGSVVRADVPTLAFVPRSGAILVGQAAQEAIATDPAGMIDDLKRRMGGGEFLRHRRTCTPFELIALTLAETRRLAFDQRETFDPLTDCTLTVPLHFDTQQQELLRAAARRAGFISVGLMDEPVAAARSWERHRAIVGNVLVVCDIGHTARIAVLRRPAQKWQADLEILPPPIDRPDSLLPRLMFDNLCGVSEELKRRGLPRPPLLVVGGGARIDGIADTLELEGWPGEILIALDPEVATVRGAVDVISETDGDDDDVTEPGIDPHPDWISPDGTLSLADYHLTDLKSIISACIPKIRAGHMKKLHMLGEDWRDEHVKRVCNLLRPKSGDNWVINEPERQWTDALYSHPGLAALEITSARQLSAAAMLDLASLSTLTKVNLSGWRVCEASVDGIQHLIRLPKLQTVNLPRSLDRLPLLRGMTRRDLLCQFFQKSNPHLAIL